MIFNHKKGLIVFLLLISAGFYIIYINFDSLNEKWEDFINPSFNISVINSSLNNYGDLEFEVLLENNSDHLVSVGNLELTYIAIPTRANYEKRNREISIGKTIGKKDDLSIHVKLSDYDNPEAESWLKQKEKNFGIEITVKDNIGNTIKWVKRKIDLSS